MLQVRWFALSLGVLAPGNAFSQTLYRLTDLGHLGGQTAIGKAINSHGVVVGESSLEGTSDTEAFSWHGSSLRGLGTLGGQWSEAWDINDAGTIVGTSQIRSGGGTSAFVYQNDELQRLDVFGRPSWAYGINSQGHVVGYYNTPYSASSRAYRYSDGVVHDLGFEGYAFDVNDTGQITGLYFANGGWRAMIWDDGSIVDLGTLGSPNSSGWSINESGQVAGLSFVGDEYILHATLFSDGIVNDLGTLGGRWSEAFEVNNVGQVVGYSDTGVEFERRGFLYENGVMKDANGLIDESGTGYLVDSIRGINDAGVMTGSAVVGGEVHAVLLTPVPEPSTLAGLGIAVIWMIRKRRTR